MVQLRQAAWNVSLMFVDASEFVEFHTGIPLLWFVTAIVLILSAYYLISGIPGPAQIVGPHDDLAAPAAHRDLTSAKLEEFDGRDPAKPLLIAVKGQIYDVSTSKDFFGLGGLFSLAGRDASRALAKMSFLLTGDLDGLTSQELEVLEDFETKFSRKYPRFGAIVPAKEEQKPSTAVRRAPPAAREEQERPRAHDDHDKEVGREPEPSRTPSTEEKQEIAIESARETAVPVSVVFVSNTEVPVSEVKSETENETEALGNETEVQETETEVPEEAEQGSKADKVPKVETPEDVWNRHLEAGPLDSDKILSGLTDISKQSADI